MRVDVFLIDFVNRGVQRKREIAAIVREKLSPFKIDSGPTGLIVIVDAQKTNAVPLPSAPNPFVLPRPLAKGLIRRRNVRAVIPKIHN